VNRLNLSGYKELKNFEDHSMSILVLLPVRGVEVLIIYKIVSRKP
jgi:hypothetical protein